MKTLNVMDLQFNYKAALRGYESAVVTRVWNGIGSLELLINTEITNAGLIAEDDLLWFDNEYHKAFIVERIEEDLGGNKTNLKITAPSINTLIHDFITLPPVGEGYDTRTGTREAIVRAWVTENCISPVDATRHQYPIVLAAYHGLGETIQEQSRHINLADEITRILTGDDLGWRLELDIPNTRFLFNVLEGSNLTAGQSTNPRVLFGLKYGNISGYRKVKDSTAAKTVAYAGGPGAGAEQTVVKVDGSATGRKKEVFIDSRDATTEAELAERGSQALDDTAATNSFEFEVLDRQFRYQQEYDLGDFVTVVISKEASQDLQIQKITETYEKNRIQVVPEFGKPERTIGGVVSAITKRISKLETVGTAEGTSQTPPGTIVLVAGSAIPEGWLECDGLAVNRSTYSVLFSAIGTAYGEGDGSTTFNLPNLKGRVPVGQDTAQTEFDTLGKSGGSKTHQLLVNEIPIHNHPQSIRNTGTAGTAGSQGGSTANNATAGTTGNTGGGEGHNNLQPYIVLKYIIKF